MEAYEKRGALRYWKYQLNIETDAAAQQNLRRRAQEDLVRAVELNGRLANAHNLLSSVYYDESRSRAVLAARKAYEEDPYLESADEALWRLYVGNLDLEIWGQAKQFCNEGARRFPDGFRFVYCQLQLMATPAADPEPERAWRLAARLDSVAPAGLEQYMHLRGRLDVAGALARASRAGGALDTVLLASARSVLDRTSAEISRGGEVGWQWRDLQAHPGFDELRAADAAAEH